MKAVQSEYERLELLISEYVEYSQQIKKTSRSVKDCNEALWELIFELKLSFSNLQSETSTLFKETTQLTNNGYQRMFACYQSGAETLNTFITTGLKKWKSKWDLEPMKVAKDNKKKKASSSSIQVSELYNIEIEEPSTKNAEEEVLNKLENYKDASLLPSEIVKELVEQLEEVEQLLKLPKYWTSTQVRHRWYYRYRYKQLKNSQQDLGPVEASIEDIVSTSV
ncbi:hypothetical protein C2G38_2171760 [Gigaspora rosea]|uniref:Uncharacterized protein n=1 Tax=Gigaspora rosea TaxID=44941 RepID=A0A397VW85_9GLOM|nr:hypothetical protein C2G38_2171760 [Gigaspora rosea]